MIRLGRPGAGLLAFAILAALGLGAPPAALAAAALSNGTPLRTDDARRLAELDAAYGIALREAFAGASAADIATAVDALSGPVRAARPEDLLGDWSCRTIKLGGITPMVAYQPFRCRVTREGGRVVFDKISGSQRVRGEIMADGDRLVLLGVGYIAGDTPPAYAQLPEDLDTSQTPQLTAAPGVVEMTGADSGRILFPWPMLESHFDVLELTR